MVGARILSNDEDEICSNEIVQRDAALADPIDWDRAAYSAWNNPLTDPSHDRKSNS